MRGARPRERWSKEEIGSALALARASVGRVVGAGVECGSGWGAQKPGSGAGSRKGLVGGRLLPDHESVSPSRMCGSWRRNAPSSGPRRAAEDAQYMYADRLEERVMDGRGGENVRGRERGSNGAAVQVPSCASGTRQRARRPVGGGSTVEHPPTPAHLA